jgi:cyclophilin family peptidyl-prolyl cis-trans isomerase
MVATAAEVLFKKPGLAFEVSAEERRAALDPHKALPADGHVVAKVVAKSIEQAMDKRMSEQLPEDAIEIRVGLLDAATALGMKSAMGYAKQLCESGNATERKRAESALRSLGSAAAATCPGRPSTKACTPLAPTGEKVRVRFLTDAGELFLFLDPELAPRTSLRIKQLVESGFYNGIEVHRVVPGFVAQFGDKLADGYGGSGELLRCETGLAPFELGTVGMALSGRDTGSSQLFVGLARAPHLDGEYTVVGRAKGDWSAVAEGDLIQKAEVVPLR